MIVYDSRVMADLIGACRQANDELRDAQDLLMKIQSHNDWNCKEKTAINEHMNTCKKEIRGVTEDYASFLNALYSVDNGWSEAERNISSQFDSVDDLVQNVLGIPAGYPVCNGGTLLGPIVHGTPAGTLTNVGMLGGMSHIMRSVISNLTLIPFPNLTHLAEILGAIVNGGGTGSTGTSGNSNTSDTPAPQPSMTPEAIVQDLNERYNRLREARGTTYQHFCGTLVFDQLRDQGILVNGESTQLGKDLAPKLAEKGTTSTGYTCTSYPNNTGGFDQLVAQSQSGPVTNVVLSFGKGGNFSADAGHAVLISRIQDGRVYFVDNTIGCSVENLDKKPYGRGTNTGNYAATSLTIQEFKEFYLEKTSAKYGATNVTGIVHLHK